MTNFTTVVENNPVRFVKEVERAINDGYIVDTSLPYGSLSVTGGLFELHLYERTGEHEKASYGAVKAVETHSPNDWIQQIADAVASGYGVVEESVEYDSVGIKRCTLVSADDGVESKKQLDDMAWEDLREFAKQVGAENNRMRSVLVNNVLKVLNQRRSLLKLPLIE